MDTAAIEFLKWQDRFRQHLKQNGGDPPGLREASVHVDTADVVDTFLRERDEFEIYRSKLEGLNPRGYSFNASKWEKR